jgi:hypothetical protein
MTLERTAIRALRANVTRSEAFAALEGGWWRQALGRQLRSVADAYLPFRLYQVEVVNRGARSHWLYAGDAVTGALDLYRFDEAPGDAELVTLETRNRATIRLDEAQGCAALESKLRRAVYQSGFFRVRGLQFVIRPTAQVFFVPYWLGFYGNADQADVRVMDAVRRRFEGAKARCLVEDWLTAGG